MRWLIVAIVLAAGTARADEKPWAANVSAAAQQQALGLYNDGNQLFDDGAYVTATDAANEHLLGARIDQVGALSTGALLQAFDASWPGSRAWRRQWRPRQRP